MSEEFTLEDLLNTPVHDETVEKVVLLMDSDTFAFRAASVTDGRQYIVGRLAFKYKADVVKYCKENDIPVEGIEPVFYPEPFEHAVEALKATIGQAINNAKAYLGKPIVAEFYHTGSKNFRKDILKEYKANRKDQRKPEHLGACKQYIAENNYEVTEEGLEADDLIGIRAYELAAQGREYMIVTVDKDLRTIPGPFMDWVNIKFYTSSREEAMKFFYAQTIAGDNVDNIPGVSGLAINKKGTGKAQKIIQTASESCPEDKSLEVHLYEAAFNAWLDGGPGKKGSYGCKSLEEVHREYSESAKCLFILHQRGVHWSVPTDSYSNF